MLALVISTMKTFGKQTASAMDLVKTKGASEILYLMAAVAVTSFFLVISLALYAIVLLHQALVWAFSTFLLVNVSFFDLRPHPASPKFHTRRRASLTASMASSRRASLSLTTSPTAEDASSQSNGQRIEKDALPLIDLSSRASEAGESAPEVLVPAVLSPTQLQIRSLSPAFDQSIKAAKESDIAEILAKSSSKPTSSQPASLGALLLKRRTFGSSMADTYGSGIRLDAGRSMSTVSYPDVGDGLSDDSEEIGGLREEPIEEGEENEGSVAVQYSGRTDVDEDEDYEDDETENPRPDSEIDEIPFSSSPGQAAVELADIPEKIDVLDPQSRQATLDLSAPKQEPKSAVPEPAFKVPSKASLPSLTPPPSQVTLPAAKKAEEKAVDESPRDLFSPKPVSFPQPISSLPFALPFNRDHQRTSSESSDAGARWNTTSDVEVSQKKDEPVVKTPPYPSPPFTPPSTRPPTMYTSMAPALQMPAADSSLNPFVLEKSQLSALVEEAKAKLESEKEASAQRPSQAPDHDVTVDETEESAPRFPEPPTFVQPQVAPEVTSTPEKVAMPIPVAAKQRTLVSADAEEPLNEVDGAGVNMDNESPERPFSPAGAASGADDESTAPKDPRKKKKKTKKSKSKKGVSFDDNTLVITSEQEGEMDDDASDSRVSVNFKAPTAMSLPSSSLHQPIPVPRTFELEDDDDSEAPILRSTSPLANEVFRASPIPDRRMSMLSNSRRDSIISSTADEMSDSSSAFPIIPGEYSAKQVDHYARWFARAHRDKSLPSIQALRDQMKECSDTELASRIKLGSRSEATKLSKTLVGEDLGKGVPSGGVVPPVRKGSFRRGRYSSPQAQKRSSLVADV